MANRRPSGDHADRARRVAKIIIPVIREVARRHGYAIGVHGSLRYDIDLIACPWTSTAVSARALAEATQKAIEAVIGQAFDPDLDDAVKRRNKDLANIIREGKRGCKPHGRLVWTFHIGGGPYIDFSVMPRLDK